MTPLPESLRKAAVKACPWPSEHSAFSGRNDVQYHDEWMAGVEWLWQHLGEAPLKFDQDVTDQAYLDYKWPTNVTVTSKAIWRAGARWQLEENRDQVAWAKYNYDHDTSNARTMAKRIAELENKLDLQIGQWLKAKDEANVLRSKLERLTRCSCGGGQISGLPPMKGTHPDACSQCGGWR